MSRMNLLSMTAHREVTRDAWLNQSHDLSLLLWSCVRDPWFAVCQTMGLAKGDEWLMSDHSVILHSPPARKKKILWEIFQNISHNIIIELQLMSWNNKINKNFFFFGFLVLGKCKIYHIYKKGKWEGFWLSKKNFY